MEEQHLIELWNFAGGKEDNTVTGENLLRLLSGIQNLAVEEVLWTNAKASRKIGQVSFDKEGNIFFGSTKEMD